MKGFLKILLWLLLAGVMVFVLPVAALRWLPAPTSAFMLASDTTPVRYQWVSAGNIPDAARRAVVASEDQKFFEHQGFDIEAMQKAYANNQKKGRRVRGASTISQQTAKNLFLWSGGGYFRKGVEAIYTVLIEALWPKQRILTVYLNIAEFGPGIYGVEAASQAFFKKPASKLSVSDAARLAAVLPSPRKWSVTKAGPYVQKRTLWILRQMGAGPRAKPVDDPEPEPLPGPEAEDATEPEPQLEPTATPEPASPTPEQQLQQQLQQEEQQRDTPVEQPAPPPAETPEPQ
ncbi:MAG: monofunctional biosynthetic peptidoglycan transglycosylase [Stagnimonas sp.]|nr:monofunctional biosynthetic peptidoglycan transglycosylase [Stagnimonas sp.]